MKTTKEELEFLEQSNFIEGEYSSEALDDAVEAWKYAKGVRIPDWYCTLGIHERLMKRLNPEIAGVKRKCNVWVGGRKCPNAGQINRLISHWESDHSNAKTEEEIKEAHVAWEKIHPFEDGNGRTGRIIMNIQRLNNGLPILVIHQGEEQTDYYQWFK